MARVSRPLYFFLAAIIATPTAWGAIDGRMVVRLKPQIVNVSWTVQIGLNSEASEESKASGFIVDAKRGIIATNAHVTGTSPSQVRIIFLKGESAPAKVLYYDPWHDFGFFKVDPAGTQVLSSQDFRVEARRTGMGFGRMRSRKFRPMPNALGFLFDRGARPLSGKKLL